MTKNSSHRSHTAYLLRVWHTSDNQIPRWRASLTEVTTKQKIGFTDPESLVAFLFAIDAQPAGTQAKIDLKGIQDVDEANE